MGVTGLWQIVQPCARPIKLETLNRRRLAVDASIWIYQFLKAVRDKEGHALRNSHVVGFFRRICKLLFFGIKPVFVFDGGAPALKRSTIAARKARREGRREDAARTAGKLLAVQMQRRAEEEEASRRAAAASGRQRHDDEEEEAVPDDAPYVGEAFLAPRERVSVRQKFRKTDAYHLPELDMSLNAMRGAGDDPRVMSLEELEAYARQFETGGDDISVYDFSKIDYDGAFFSSLPAADRYNILNAARLRSRLRMGHSKEQLDSMFPDRMAFSKFQIERVRERNELTQRLMHLNGFQDGMEFGGGRVAGEKGREYVLVKNDGVEGGWALGVISDEGGREKPIDVDKPVPAPEKEAEDEWEDDDDFEDVPIVGLNRLPKQRASGRNDNIGDNYNEQLAQQRQDLYKSRNQAARRKRKPKHTRDSTSLFVQSDEEGEEDGLDVHPDDGEESNEDEELRRAIAMSLEKGVVHEDQHVQQATSEAEDDDMLEVFQQSAVMDERPLPKGSGRAIANIVNKRAFNAAPESREITSFGVPALKPDDSDEEDSMDFQAALAESRRTKRKASPPRPTSHDAPSKSNPKKPDSVREIAREAGFSGPLPFESLDLGSSLLGKKKMQQRTEEAAGGFENPDITKKQQKQAEPLPPWFAGDIEKDIRAQKAIEQDDRQRAKEFSAQFSFQDRGASLRRQKTNEIIDLEADEAEESVKHGEVIDLEATKDGANDQQSFMAPPIDDVVRMGDVADKVRAEPPAPADVAETQPVPLVESDEASSHSDIEPTQTVPVLSEEGFAVANSADANSSEDGNNMLDWGESDGEGEHASESTKAFDKPDSLQETEAQQSRSPSAEFEDVAIPDAPAPEQVTPNDQEDDFDGPVSMSGLAPQDSIPEADEFDDFSDPEEQEMLRALTLEAEEHARFASSLNNKPQSQNVEEYDRELKKLRNQQKKDRRDADEVTHIMITECQQLLQLFGLPYITAPMEAEAQCAELVSLGLVDGIVTDDSDCFLFGGTRIYKNMFNAAKFVECYLASDLEKEFDLTRDKLISVAQLLGSDYTEGLPGVGPVTALEIISEFPTLDEFKTWWSGVQMNSIPKSVDANKPFRKKFRRNATKLFLPPAFPDARVHLAYTTPEVDDSPEAFQWGVPDLDALRAFLMATIGWSQERTDEVLVPVIRDMNRRLDEGTQANITAFFDGGIGVGAASSGAKGESFAPRKRVAGSKRMGSALSKMAERAKLARDGSGKVDDDDNDDHDVNDANEEHQSSEEAMASSKRQKVQGRSAEPDVDAHDDVEAQLDTRSDATPRAGNPKATAKKGKASTSRKARGRRAAETA